MGIGRNMADIRVIGGQLLGGNMISDERMEFLVHAATLAQEKKTQETIELARAPGKTDGTMMMGLWKLLNP